MVDDDDVGSNRRLAAGHGQERSSDRRGKLWRRLGHVHAVGVTRYVWSVRPRGGTDPRMAVRDDEFISS